MSSEEFEKLHEIYRSLYDELKLMPERVLKSHGGKHFYMFTKLCNQSNKQCKTGTCVVSAEERKRLVRTFDERQGEAEEVVSCSPVSLCWKCYLPAMNFNKSYL